MMNKFKFTLALVLMNLFSLQSCDKQEVVAEEEIIIPEQLMLAARPNSNTENENQFTNPHKIRFHWPVDRDGTPVSDSTRIWTRFYYTFNPTDQVLQRENFGFYNYERWYIKDLGDTYYILPWGTSPPDGQEIPFGMHSELPIEEYYDTPLQ